MKPPWHYDELQQLGADFEDAAQVAAYDAKQGSDPEAERSLIVRLGIQRGAIVVDLGCGTASFARAAALHGAVVHAVDVSQAMLDYARDRAVAEGLTSIQFHRAGFLTFDRGVASVDFVVSRFALHHLPDFWKQVALIRLARMLRPGGKLFLRDVVFSFPPADYERALEYFVDRMPRVTGYAREEFETHVREENSTFTWVIGGMLERAGLEILEYEVSAPEYAQWVCRRP
jgi:putative AdoMet-dependent methyltransferase